MEPQWIYPGTMPNLSIKNVPEAVVEKLRARAAANHRSLQGELMALVCDAADGGAPWREQLDDEEAQQTGWMTVEELMAEHKARRPEPVTGVSLAVDIIRRDRDSR